MIYWVNKDARYLVQLVFISNFYLPELLAYTFIYFMLMVMSLYLLFFFYFKNKKENDVEGKTIAIIVISIIAILVASIALLMTVFWPYALFSFIASFTVVYSTYAITKHLYEESPVNYKDNECVKEESSFKTNEEAQKYLNEFSEYWAPYFKDRGFYLAEQIDQAEDGTYRIAIYIKKTKKD